MIKKYERNSINATLVKKVESIHYPMPGNMPFHETMYELLFATENGQLNFEVSIFEYNVVQLGNEGILVFEKDKIISFGDWLSTGKEIVEE